MTLRDLIGRSVILRAPSWGCGYDRNNWYYGWRHSLHIGPWLIFWGVMTEAEILRTMEADAALRGNGGAK